MRTYTIKVRQLNIRVEAESYEAAEQKAKAGNGKLVGIYFAGRYEVIRERH